MTWLACIATTAFPWTSGSAASLTRSERAQTTAPTSTSLGPITATRSRLRKLLERFCSSCGQTRTVGVCWPQASTIARACFVDGASNCEASITASEPSCACEASAERSAALCALRFTFWMKVRGTFAKV